jgi:outer membrane protein TolC
MPRNLLIFFILLTSVLSNCFALEPVLVEHQDPIIVDLEMTLTQLLDKTLLKYPDTALIPALQQESQALQQRGQSWLAEAPRISLSYLDDAITDKTGYHEFVGALELPLWNWGQRHAGQLLAEQARVANNLKQKIIRLRVTGLLRDVLWDIALQKQRLELSTKTYQIAEQLQKKIKLRVDVGDLPHIDLLLAESELLEQQTKLIAVQAETMHARKQLATLTQDIRIPVNFTEQQSPIQTVDSEHPLLRAANAIIERKRAQVKWVKATGSGQSTLSIGGKSERDSRDGQDIESIGIGLSVPFGGSAHLAPEIASAQLALSEAIANRDHLYRKLERQLHEAEHNLEVGRVEVKIAEQRKVIAEEHLRVTELSFNAGEINLMDSLKIQTRAFAAIQYANEQAINLQRNIALYNQAVGVMP